jgi:hypothetical protein
MDTRSIESLTASRKDFFESNYTALREQPPMRWMCRLFGKLTDGWHPSLLDLPTGAAKTDVLVIWMVALAWYGLERGSSYRALLKRRGLDGPNFHALRHSHASQSLADGVDIKTVSSRLGHSKASFTLAQYCHLMPGQDQEAATRTDTRMRRRSSRCASRRSSEIQPTEILRCQLGANSQNSGDEHMECRHLDCP